ncbi:sensor histidine kinase [Streptomyces physcomitrii]|uniref:histidine kinase n=1 Tax=Streptomyces physcomitrii TaxID=2724184 RepID=A0ABX1HDU1_9ACTN|nr:HAMP domain-containing sensor histidine kinase [Streptomyces physcomitrii]NKI45405.1 HAMP domain-containing histidine kinase [Streptomyces physcomitrii]
MRRPFASVRARATLAATLVVAVALVLAGFTVLTALRSSLSAEAGNRAESAARDVAAQLAGGRAPGELELPDAEDSPVQVVDEDGRLLAADEDLEAVTGTGTGDVRPPRASGSPTSGSSPTSATPPSTSGSPASGSPRPERTGEGSGGDDGREETEEPDDDSDSDSGSDSGSDSDSGSESDSDDGGDDSDSDREGDDDGWRGRPGEIDSEAGRAEGSATVDGETSAYRFAVVHLALPSGEQATVYAGASLDAEHDANRTALTVMLIGLPVLLLVVGGVTWLVTGRALRPVEGIRREMAAITASEDLRRRVPEPATHDEIARLAATTNETLTALESSVERQRRFVADASHELRSPIASLRTQLEVAAAHPQLLDLDGAVADTVRLEQLAADLLLLARLDAGERPAGTRFDLGELVARTVAERRPGRVRVRTAIEAAQVTGSRGQLARVLGNLLDNAERHAAAEVLVTVRAEPGAAVLEVSDDGAGVPEADRERVFARFVRLDEARTRDEGGAGLGLAIARDVAERHGGTLELGEGPEGGARFVLRIPKGGGEGEGKEEGGRGEGKDGHV